MPNPALQAALLQFGMSQAGASLPGMAALPANILAALQGGQAMQSQVPVPQQHQQPLMVPSAATQQNTAGQQQQPQQPQQSNNSSDLSQYSRDQLMFWAHKYRMGGDQFNPQVTNAVSDELRRRETHGKQ